MRDLGGEVGVCGDTVESRWMDRRPGACSQGRVRDTSKGGGRNSWQEYPTGFGGL